ncbi:MAG: hypothetical protein Q4D02_06695 [Clostridia bacterium]|nr:hypothetical protein [Clostridia bacterium]
MKIILATLLVTLGLAFITSRQATYDIVGSLFSVEMDYEKVKEKKFISFVIRALLLGMLICLLPRAGVSRLYFNYAIIYICICMHLSNLKIIGKNIPGKFIIFEMIFRLTIFFITI